jgi:ABC-2 type transport system permease protein
MIHRSLVKKYFLEAWPLLLAIALAVFLFCWFRVWIVGELDSGQFRQIIELLPKDWRKFSPVDFEWLISYLGRTSLCLDEPLLILLVIGWGIVRGSDVVSGELNRGSMEMLLSQPLSRPQVYWTHAFCTVLGLICLTLIAWLAMAVGIFTTSVEETTYPTLWIPFLNAGIPLRFLQPKVETIAMITAVNPTMFLPGVIQLLGLGYFFAGLSAMCSASDRYRWRTLGIVAAFYFVNAGLKILGLSSEKWNWVQHLSVFGFFSPAGAIERASGDLSTVFHLLARNGTGEITGTGSLTACLMMFGLGSLFYLLGSRIFSRRDLPAPV